MCGCISHAPSWGTWPTTQACAPTGNWTGDLMVLRPELNLLSHTSQGQGIILLVVFKIDYSNAFVRNTKGSLMRWYQQRGSMRSLSKSVPWKLQFNPAFPVQHTDMSETSHRDPWRREYLSEQQRQPGRGGTETEPRTGLLQPQRARKQWRAGVQPALGRPHPRGRNTNRAWVAGTHWGWAQCRGQRNGAKKLQHSSIEQRTPHTDNHPTHTSVAPQATKSSLNISQKGWKKLSSLSGLYSLQQKPRGRAEPQTCLLAPPFPHSSRHSP